MQFCEWLWKEGGRKEPVTIDLGEELDAVLDAVADTNQTRQRESSLAGSSCWVHLYAWRQV